MTFLPIVERELRVATRRRSTYWLRVVAAGIALIIGSGMLLMSLIPFAGPMPGSALFGTLTWMSLMAALSSGLFFTADCLSEEKREGTLGFLFLTDLRGYDVVLGKLLVSSLRSLLPLLAIFPILATTLLLGGVEVAHFWRTVLAIVNAAFFSLATGLFVSSLSRHSLKAMAGTLVLLALFIGVGPFIDSLWSLVNGRSTRWMSLASPGYVFASANYGKTFWPAFLISHGVGWLLFGLASFLVRRTWQEKPASSLTIKLPLNGRSPSRASGRSRSRDAQLRDQNPVAWLVAREWGHALVLWLLTAVMLATFLILLLTDAPTMLWRGWSGVNNLITYALYLWVAARSCQLFADARRSGALELLLASPLTSRQTVQGAWYGLLRSFALPVVLLTGLQLATAAITGGPGWVGNNFEWTQALALATDALVIPMNLVALMWFGLWMGLTSRNALTATLKTIVFAQIIPLIAIYFLAAMSLPLIFLFTGVPMQGGAPSQTVATFWLPLFFGVVPSALKLLKDVIFWACARRKLVGNFRELAMRSLIPVQTSLPPVIKAP